MNKMILVGAVVIIVIVAAGAFFLVGNKNGTQPGATSSINSTGSSNASGSKGTGQPTGSSLDSWVGKNLTLTEFSKDFANETNSKATNLNETYKYTEGIALSSGAYQENTTTNGMITIEIYYNSSRITTSSNSSFGVTLSNILIYNSSSRTIYSCNKYNGNYTCYVGSTNVSESSANLANTTGSLGFLTGGGSAIQESGYFNNISVSNGSYNGQSCTSLKGNLYLSTGIGTSKTSFAGMFATCISTASNTWLVQSIKGIDMLVGNGGTTVNASVSYNETLVSTGAPTTASITALPGPVA